MSDLFWLSEAQMRRIEQYFPRSHRVPRIDNRRLISGIIFVIRNGLRWRDAPRDYGPRCANHSKTGSRSSWGRRPRSRRSSPLPAGSPSRTTAPERIYDLPTGADRLVARSTGIEHVWVGGRATRRAGVDLEVDGPGRLVRPTPH